MKYLVSSFRKRCKNVPSHKLFIMMKMIRNIFSSDEMDFLKAASEHSFFLQFYCDNKWLEFNKIWTNIWYVVLVLRIRYHQTVVWFCLHTSVYKVRIDSHSLFLGEFVTFIRSSISLVLKLASHSKALQLNIHFFVSCQKSLIFRH